MFASLRFRLWLTYALIVGVVLVIAGSGVFFYLLRNPAIDRRELQRLNVLSALLLQRSQALSGVNRNSPPELLNQIVRRVDTTSSVRAALYSSDGELLADSRAGSAPNLPRLAVLQKAAETETPVFRDAARRQWLFELVPVDNELYLLIAAPRARTSLTILLRDEIVTLFGRGALLALVLSLIMAFLMADWITKPLQHMADSARSMSAGEFKAIPPKGPGEVQALARALNEMGEKVQASQRSQRDFIANVSHDLKTPLTSIQGFAQAILDGTASDPQSLRQAAGVIHSEAGRMHRMVLDLLELARLDSGVVKFERTRLDIAQVLQGVVMRFSPQANQAQVDLQLVLNNPMPPLVGDPERMAQVFANLVENSLKYTPSGGQVLVTARPAAEWVEVSVADTGPGIPEDEQQRIFERFYQTDKSRSRGSRSGVGLGLAIAREIVQAHGGMISAYNRGTLSTAETLQGSVFLVRLPLPRSDDSTLVRRR
jgi:two-component system OmpR family sensor kinase